MSITSPIANLIINLHQIGAVKIDTRVGFKLKHHEKYPNDPLSPIYLDLRTADNPKGGPLTAREIQHIVTLWLKRINKERIEFDALAGLPNAGTPLVEALQQAMRFMGKKYPIIPLKKNKEGINEIENDPKLPPGSVILVVDDVITRGESKKEAIQTLELDGGYEVHDILVVVDREQKGAEYLKKHDIRLHLLCTLREMIDYLKDTRKITPNEHTKIIGYLYASQAA